MKKQSNSKFHLNLALCLLILGTAGLAQTSTQNNDALFQKAQNIASSNPAGALAAYELVMQQSAERDSKVFAHAVGEYWNLIHKDNNYPRAYDFFTQLAAAHPSSADVLGSEGSAIGGYLGWLHTNGFAQHADQQFLASLYSKAHDAFEKALKIDPKHMATLHNLVIVHLEERDFPAAEQVLKQMEQIDPKYEGLEPLKKRLAEVKGAK